MEAKTIPLTQGKHAIVDAADFGWLNQWKWLATRNRYKWYAARKGAHHRLVLMHREVMCTPRGMETDHKNGDGLDNRRSNLRNATRAQNGQNRGAPINNKSGHRGVSWNKSKNKWQAYICVFGNRHELGAFVSLQDAVAARIEAAKTFYGEFFKA